MRSRAVLDDVDALPRSERHPSVFDWHREVDPGQHGLDMSRHVVRPLRGVNPASIGRSEATKRRQEVGLHIRIGILLDSERC